MDTGIDQTAGRAATGRCATDPAAAPAAAPAADPSAATSTGRPAARRGPQDTHAAPERRDRDIIRMVERAVAAENVMLAFQPVVAAGRHDRPVFYEGLIRILDDRGRIIPARDFIGPVESLELGRRIDCLTLALGLRTLRQRPRLRLSINMSARSIAYPAWRRTLEDGLAEDPALGERLILEIGEDSTVQMPDIVQIFLAEYQPRGLSFALDSFGAGMSALGQLRQLPFDILKIDGQFVRGIARSPEDQALLKALLGFGRHFDMVTVAECVESSDDARCLARLGVDCLQGYYFGAPTVRPRWAPCRDEGAA